MTTIDNNIARAKACGATAYCVLSALEMTPSQLDAYTAQSIADAQQNDAADAALYRWLRDEKNWSEDGITPIIANGEDTIYGDHLDQAIRAATAAQGEVK